MCQGLMLVFLVFTMGSSWAEEVYRWQDGSGTWHFTGQQSAPVNAKPFVAAVPVSVVEMHVSTAYEHVEETGGRKKPKKLKVSKVGKSAWKNKYLNDREYHLDYCEKWRERLYRTRLGQRDHEDQAAYERECILKVHW